MAEEPIGNVTKELTKEIEDAVNSVVESQKEKGEGTDDFKSAPSDGDNTGGVVGDSGSVESKVIKNNDGSATDGNADDFVVDTSSGPDKTEEIIEAPEFLNDEILARAIDAGISLSDALSFPNEQALERVIIAIERRAPGIQKSEKKEEILADDPFSALPKLDPDSYDPEVIAYFNTLTGIVKKQQEELRASQARDQRTAQFTKEQAGREVETWFDKQVEKLGDGYLDALGAGRYRSLNQGSPQFKNREKLAETMTILLSGYNATGKTPPPREELFDMAIGMTFANKIEEIHGQKIAKDLETRASQHIQRAGGRKAQAILSPEQEAAEALALKFNISV